MAVAEYYDRAALAAAQVVAGFEADAFRARIESVTVGLSIDARASRTAEGRALAELATRLLARLYPYVQIDSPHGPLLGRLRRLAQAINPQIEFREGAKIGIAVGSASRTFDTTVFAGSTGWVARVGTAVPYSSGSSDNPCGAGAAACIAAANVFRHVFLSASEADLDSDVGFSTLTGERVLTSYPAPLAPMRRGPKLVVVGLGAIGNAVIWTLGRAPISGTIDIIDHELVELSNLQRYVLATPADVGRPKTAVVGRFLPSAVRVGYRKQKWQQYAALRKQKIGDVLVALDSAADRRAVQAALPRSVANAWTQPGDLGVSSHGRFGAMGACITCLYLVRDAGPNDDEIVATALGVPDKQQDVRRLLHTGAEVGSELGQLIAERLGVTPDQVDVFGSRGIRELYVTGLCGGALVPLEQLGRPRAEMHVPLAHQSALAGVLLAAMWLSGFDALASEATHVTRINVLRSLAASTRQPMVADEGGGCICRDPAFVARHLAKWPNASPISQDPARR
jgi:hypothetical protein